MAAWVSGTCVRLKSKGGLAPRRLLEVAQPGHVIDHRVHLALLERLLGALSRVEGLHLQAFALQVSLDPMALDDAERHLSQIVGDL